MKFSAGWTVTDVCDTRDYDLVGDTWKPVAGSGDPQPCDCCGKAIVIHVHVSRGDERAIVGQACARKLSGAIAAGAKAMPVRRANLGNNETWTVGLVQDGADWLALTFTESKTFKGRAAAENWLAKRGYLPDGTKIQN